jgi:hypothetical protein
MGKREEIFVRGISHHIGLFYQTLNLLSIYYNSLRKLYSLDYLVSSSPRNLDVNAIERVAIKGVLNIFDFKL